jgi:hypothetical protein
MLDPSYMFGQSIQQTLAVGQDKKKKNFKNTDHFGGEMKYFSDCILNGTDPEPPMARRCTPTSGSWRAYWRALKSGGAVQLSHCT